MIKRILTFVIASLFFFELCLSENNDIYKKIDIFGEVLKKN